MATMQEIAKLAGVSRITVSNILNGKTRGAWAKSQRQAARIRKIADQVGYRLNAAAKATATGRFNNVVLVQSLRGHTGPIVGDILAGVHDRLMEAGIHLTLSRLGDDLLTDESYVPHFVRTWMCDAILMNYQAGIPPRLMALVATAKLPVVWLNAKRESDCVYLDDFGAGRLAAQALYQAGHRRIAIFDKYIERAKEYDVLHYSRPDRLEGARRFLDEQGVSAHLVLPTNNDPEEQARRIMIEVLRMPEGPTAVIAYGYGEICAAIHAAYTLGLRIPQDVSLVTFGGQQVMIPSGNASTVILPELAMGGAAGEMVLEKIAAPEKALKARVIPCTVVEGNTIAPPKTG